MLLLLCYLWSLALSATHTHGHEADHTCGFESRLGTGVAVVHATCESFEPQDCLLCHYLAQPLLPVLMGCALILSAGRRLRFLLRKAAPASPSCGLSRLRAPPQPK